MMEKYNLTPFNSMLHEWITCFKIKDDGKREEIQFAVKMNSQDPSLYGICDMVFNLTIPNEFEKYLSAMPNETKDDWIKTIQSYQNPKTGWFKEGLINYGMHFKEHSSAFSIAALQLLGGAPKYDFKIAKRLCSRKKVHSWLKRRPEWGILYWPGSHRGGGVAAIFATLGEEFYPHPQFFEWYFDWLDENADSEVGFWRLGWIHKITKDRLTIQELGGAVHYYWIYEYFDHPIPYPEKVIDSTLSLQKEFGTWDKEYSYCLDLDAIFCLTRCCEQTKGYRKEDITGAIIKYLDYIIEKMNTKDFVYTHYQSAHTLTGYVCAIAEIYKYYPNLFEEKIEYVQTLDITPWI
ncbi:MAG: hypothetical protein BAJALOKI1v1_1420003 [Promethearchaeota archaeon]|nr:MAG: hypothetical protein BAJALOKI1v1_1420003 [Candidatus Lokiarchaeota archaeon]